MNDPIFEDDIPESLARAAHEGTSHVPEERGRQERSAYANTLRQDYEHFREQAERGGTVHLLEEEFIRYRAGLATRTLAYLRSRSRCLSSMITGPANFPTARNQKRNATADKRSEELLDYRKRAKAAILRKLWPDLQPIRAGDGDALDRLKANLEQLEGAQAQMKAANAAIRKHKKDGRDTQLQALEALGFPRGAADDLLKPNSFGDVGFADFTLKNNNANIRRVKARIEVIAKAHAMPTTEVEGTAARLEDDPPANRVRLFFPAKPSREVIETLKANAFRWKRSLGAWQAFRNPESLRLAKQIAGVA
jgi:hypothetical protein